MISKETAVDIALAYQEIERSEKLLSEIQDAVQRREMPELRDAFGRRQDGLQLGVPSGDCSQRLFNVPWTMCKPVIEAHIMEQKALLIALNEKAAIELKH